MKIGIYDPYLDDLGGGEKYMMKIAECLSGKHDATVFWDKKGDVDELVKRFSLNLSKVKFAKNIFAKEVRIFERLFETAKFDVIVVLSDGSIPFVLSRKLFLHFQQPMEHITSLSWLVKLKLARVAGVFCNSYFVKSFIDKTFNIDTEVIYPPVDLYTKKVRKENIILNVGRLRVRDVTVAGAPIGDYKKQTVMIEAFEQLVEGGLRGWKFVLVISIKDADKKAFAEIKRRARSFPIEFVVNQNNRQVWDYFNRAKIYWHASGYGEDLEKHPEYAEHFGIATVEAMGAGAVPVVIAAGGQKEIVEDGVNGLLWETLDDLKTKTLDLVNNKNLWEKLSEAAKKRAKFFSGDRFCQEVSKMLEES